MFCVWVCSSTTCCDVVELLSGLGLKDLSVCFVCESISSNCCDVLEGLSGLGVKDLSVCFVCESISSNCCDVLG